MGLCEGISLGLWGILRGLASGYQRLVVRMSVREIVFASCGRDGGEVVRVEVFCYFFCFVLVFNTVCSPHVLFSSSEIEVFLPIEHIASTDSKT